MNRSIRKAGGALLSFIMLMGMIGCSDPAAVKDEGAQDQKVTLKFVWWGSESRKESTLKVIELYKKDNPHVDFETEVLANTAAVATQLAIQTANQETADIIQADYNFIFNYINRDLIEPLDPYVKDNVIHLSDVDKAYLTSGMKDDSLYALTIGINSSTLIYDPKLLEAAGVPVPKEEYTLDELYQTMLLLKQKIKSPDFYPLGNMIDVFYYMRARGVSMYNKEGTALGYPDDKLLADYFALNKKWRDEGLLGGASSSGNDKNHPIATGKAAFYSLSSNTAAALSKASGRPLKLLPYPKVDGGQEGNFIKPSMFLAMSSYSKHKKEAAKFIDFFLNNEEANDILNGERGVPVSAKIASRLSTKLDEAGKEQYRLLDYLKTRSKPVDPPYPSAHVVVNKAYELALKQVTEGKLTPEQAAKQYREQAKEYLVGEGEGVGQ
ncbi:ABC transporter substrate-binding protein [Paenibacillus puerhi]|uniref:ABC transporter substrate-binding protein n=1 Tax=Paenibacillus puerhi TaxID=2692622 RepID=UPI00135690D5|nr:ABC transporter substrate-binding protein [Paenibacillus puerhi]